MEGIDQLRVKELVFAVKRNVQLIQENCLDESFVRGEIENLERSFEGLRNIYIVEKKDERERQKMKSKAVALIYYISRTDKAFLADLYGKIGAILKDQKKERVDEIFGKLCTLSNEASHLRKELRKIKKNNQVLLTDFTSQLDCMRSNMRKRIGTKKKSRRSRTSAHKNPSKVKENASLKSNGNGHNNKLFVKKKDLSCDLPPKCLDMDEELHPTERKTPFLLSFDTQIESQKLLFPLNTKKTKKQFHTHGNGNRRRASTRKVEIPSIYSPSVTKKDFLKFTSKKNSNKLGKKRTKKHKRTNLNDKVKNEIMKYRWRTCKRKSNSSSVSTSSLFTPQNHKNRASTNLSKTNNIRRLGNITMVKKKKLLNRTQNKPRRRKSQIYSNPVTRWESKDHSDRVFETMQPTFSSRRDLSKYLPVVEQPKFVFKDRKTGQRIVVKCRQSESFGKKNNRAILRKKKQEILSSSNTGGVFF